MKEISLLLFLSIITVSCENEPVDVQERINIKARENLDLSESAKAKRWFESNFKTSFETVNDISGGCINWGRDGTCSFTIELDINTILTPRDTCINVPCKDIHEGFTRFFSTEAEMSELFEIKCKKLEENGRNKYIVGLEKENTHYYWESYIVQ